MKNTFRFIPLFIIMLLIVSYGCEKYGTSPSPSPTPTPVVYGKISGSVSGCYIGAFINGFSNQTLYESAIGRKLSSVMWYVDFTTDFPLSDCQNMKTKECIPDITWQPWSGTVPDSTYSLQNIIDGTFDTYLTKWANDAKSFGYPIFLRFAHEMNGNWYPWSGYLNGQASGPSRFISAWRHVYNIFKTAGATNVTFVWNVNVTSVPGDSWNDIENYYPGDDYVDWIGIDGYNWGAVTDTSGTTTWQDFDSIFYSVCSSLSLAHPRKPIMIGEFASAEDGGSKASWVTNAFDALKAKYSSVKLYNWLNINKERDWRVESSSGSTSSFKASMSDATYYLDKIALP